MIEFQRTLLTLLEGGRRVAVAMLVESRGSTPQREGGRMIVAEDGETWFTIGGGSFEAMVIHDARAALAEGRSTLRRYDLHDAGEEALGMACGGRAQVFIEVAQLPDDLQIYGAGHVGRALARLAGPLGFRLSVVDDRESLLDRGAFPGGTSFFQTDRDYREALPPVTPESYLVLVTRCHETDEAALGSLVERRWRYLGLIGSHRKIGVVFERLLERGIDREKLARVHAPIGVPIGSHRPEEVAVSILAELVAVRNGVPSPRAAATNGR